LTPTYTSAPESNFAYLLAALSSILIFGIPDIIALVIPPIYSISSIKINDSLTNSSVKDSIM